MKTRWLLILALLGAALFIPRGLAQSQSTQKKPTGEKPETKQPAADVKPTARPFLWMIEGRGLKRPSFIFGTIHLPDPKVTTLPEVTKEAIRISDALYTEVPLDMQTILAMIPKVQRSDGKTLKEAIGDKLYGDLSAYVAKKGASMAMFDNMKTGIVMTQLPLLDHLKDMQLAQPLDMQLYTQAQQDEKEVGGLETIDEQLALFDAMTEQESTEILGKVLRDMKQWDADHPKEPIYDHMVDLYHSGDGDKLYQFSMSYFNPDEMVSKKLYNKLVTQRDQNMAERIEKKITEHPEKSHFFAVGALHLLTKGAGVVDRLERAGFNVRRLTPADVTAVAKLKRAEPGSQEKSSKEKPPKEKETSPGGKR